MRMMCRTAICDSFAYRFDVAVNLIKYAQSSYATLNHSYVHQLISPVYWNNTYKYIYVSPKASIRSPEKKGRSTLNSTSERVSASSMGEMGKPATIFYRTWIPSKFLEIYIKTIRICAQWCPLTQQFFLPEILFLNENWIVFRLFLKRHILHCFGLMIKSQWRSKPSFQMRECNF